MTGMQIFLAELRLVFCRHRDVTSDPLPLLACGRYALVGASTPLCDDIFDDEAESACV